MTEDSNEVRISSFGVYLPEKVLTNADLEKMVDTSDDWITSRTGIKERRIASAKETPSYMGACAALSCLEKEKIDKSSIDFILVATTTPDYFAVNTACLIQKELGLEGVPCLDIQAACGGFLYGLTVAKSLCNSGVCSNILFVCTEKLSSFVDYKDRATCILFGDGASAALIRKQGSGYLIKDVVLGASGKEEGLFSIPAGAAKNPATEETVRNGGHYFRMEGKTLFKHAVRRMGEACGTVLSRNGVTEKEVAWFISHQANERIIDAMAEKFLISQEKVYKTVQKYGNTSAASIPMCFGDLENKHSIDVGDKIVVVAFGAGLVWGSALLEKTSH